MNQSIEVTIELDGTKEIFSTILTNQTTLLAVCEMIKEAEFYNDFNLSECFNFQIKNTNQFIAERDTILLNHVQKLPNPTLVFLRGVKSATELANGVQLDGKSKQTSQYQPQTTTTSQIKKDTTNKTKTVQTGVVSQQGGGIVIGGSNNEGTNQFVVGQQNEQLQGQNHQNIFLQNSSIRNNYNYSQYTQNTSTVQEQSTNQSSIRANQVLGRDNVQQDIFRTARETNTSQLQLNQNINEEQSQIYHSYHQPQQDKFYFKYDYFPGSYRLDLIINNNRSTQFYEPNGKTLIQLEEYLKKKYFPLSMSSIRFFDSKYANIDQNFTLCQQYQYIQAFLQSDVQKCAELDIQGFFREAKIVIYCKTVIQWQQNQEIDLHKQDYYETRQLEDNSTESQLFSSNKWLATEIYQNNIKILDCSISASTLQNQSQQRINTQRQNLFKNLMQLTQMQDISIYSSPMIEQQNDNLKVYF